MKRASVFGTFVTPGAAAMRTAPASTTEWTSFEHFCAQRPQPVQG
jgi:hypothetical protein